MSSYYHGFENQEETEFISYENDESIQDEGESVKSENKRKKREQKPSGKVTSQKTHHIMTNSVLGSRVVYMVDDRKRGDAFRFSSHLLQRAADAIHAFDEFGSYNRNYKVMNPRAIYVYFGAQWHKQNRRWEVKLFSENHSGLIGNLGLLNISKNIARQFVYTFPIKMSPEEAHILVNNCKSVPIGVNGEEENENEGEVFNEYIKERQGKVGITFKPDLIQSVNKARIDYDCQFPSFYFLGGLLTAQDLYEKGYAIDYYATAKITIGNKTEYVTDYCVARMAKAFNLQYLIQNQTQFQIEFVPNLLLNRRSSKK